MNNNEFFSDSKKYKVTIAGKPEALAEGFSGIVRKDDSAKRGVLVHDEKDEGGDQTTYTIYSSVEGETKHEKDEYEIVKIINVETGDIIYKYKQLNSHSPINKFVKLGGQEWWFGGRDYMLKLFVNCDTCQVFDDPNKRECSNAYKSGSEFIWTGPLIVSPNGHFMFVNGCVWSFPNEWRLYDIRNITTNALSISYDHLPNPDPYDDDTEGRLIRQISLYEYLTTNAFDTDDERYQYEDYWLGDDDIFTFEFVSDNEITVKYYHDKEWKYYITIDLSRYITAKKI